MADGMLITTFLIECMHMKTVEESKRSSALGFTMMSSGICALSSPPLSGFMADTFGNYIAAFLMAGGVGVIGSLIPFLLICVKRQSEQNFDNNIEGIMDQGESEHINEHELKPAVVLWT
ncbi:hypothetical protein OS493_017556 [Desmophyllum pertusum]|uniref:Uncharacterized protein n=1 Tax=Desmophyllum pertusum TaxID=174260 RepID=A0A9W9ZSJ5_9CNID|nr:hypothetical protein OS493_017556 [Desmophyllum pertusum]